MQYTLAREELPDLFSQGHKMTHYIPEIERRGALTDRTDKKKTEEAISWFTNAPTEYLRHELAHRKEVKPNEVEGDATALCCKLKQEDEDVERFLNVEWPNSRGLPKSSILLINDGNFQNLLTNVEKTIKCGLDVSSSLAVSGKFTEMELGQKKSRARVIEVTYPSEGVLVFEIEHETNYSFDAWDERQTVHPVKNALITFRKGGECLYMMSTLDSRAKAKSVAESILKDLGLPDTWLGDFRLEKMAFELMLIKFNKATNYDFLEMETTDPRGTHSRLGTRTKDGQSLEEHFDTDERLQYQLAGKHTKGVFTCQVLHKNQYLERVEFQITYGAAYTSVSFKGKTSKQAMDKVLRDLLRIQVHGTQT